MTEVHLKIDSKGRICIPQDIREQIGEVATIKKTSEGYLILPGQQKDFEEEFKKVISSKPKRTGNPKLATPKEIKNIWRTKG